MSDNLTRYSIESIYLNHNIAFVEPIEDIGGVYYMVEEVDKEIEKLRNRIDYLEKLYIK